jgi:protein TonB
MPSFPGGPAELMKYLSKNINYPSLARENGLEGKVIVNFYVDTDGAIKNPTIVKDPVGGGCAEEALRVIKAMPKWSPGLQNGMPAKVYYTLPVTFKLQ